MRWMKWLPSLIVLIGLQSRGATLYVSPLGDDGGMGTIDRPLKTLDAARRAVRDLPALRKEPIYVVLKGGVYYLPETVVFSHEDSGTAAARVIYAPAPGEEVVISGGSKLDLHWEPYRDGIMKAAVPEGFSTDQLFVNGRRQIMARYPNFDPKAQYFDGWSADAFGPARAAKWADPAGGYIHAMHKSLWGDYHYLITGKDAKGNVTYEGGWQNNRQMGMHDKYRFVENIFEELDAPGEWFHNAKTHTLYFYPPKDVDLSRATVEAVRLRHLVEFRGSKQQPVRFITLFGLTFRHAARTFMDNREPLLRSDWTTYRGGAIFFNGSENCTLEDDLIDQVGGNAVFVNGYNRRAIIRSCHITGAGGNGVAFVGDPKSVRSPLFEYNQRQSFNTIDRIPGPQTDDYPADCLVDDCLIHETGRVEKQTAPVQISISMGITVRHCSIYDVPRAGININEGTFGGHIIEFCDVFDTVKETGDHGSFNSWGRDRYWNLRDIDLGKVTLGPDKDLPLLDVVRPIVLHNNRWRCDHGWDIDLDDGSTRYEIYNNLCLNGGIKNREGFYRVVENNVMVNGTFHPHLWYADSQDVFRRNIIFTAYKPIRVNKPWGQECDNNLLQKTGAAGTMAAVVLQKASGRDEHSVEGDAKFIDPAKGNYNVAADSPALKLGFKNFPMNDFGVRCIKLRAIALTPELPGGGRAPKEVVSQRDAGVQQWRGAKVKNVIGAGEISASGLPGEVGVLVLEVSSRSAAAKAGLQMGDVILKVNGLATEAVSDLLKVDDVAKKATVGIWRDQRDMAIEMGE